MSRMQESSPKGTFSTKKISNHVFWPSWTVVGPPEIGNMCFEADLLTTFLGGFSVLSLGAETVINAFEGFV